jgi:adenylate cyclase
MVGYSRLMGEDEEATVAALRRHLSRIGEEVLRHRGRVVDSPGDNLLAEFSSAVNAVRCAVEVQRAIMKENGTQPVDRRMEFRIGVHLGDVLVEGDRIYGDGVNVAARLEGIAAPGGISVSGAVFEQVRDKLDVRFEDLGAQVLKNIANPIRVYQARLADAPGHRESPSRQGRRRGRAAAGIAVVTAAAGLFLTWPRPVGFVLDWMNVTKPAESPPLPDRPSLVVLPFENLSGDPEQEYFSDGITEDLTTDLAKIPELFIISRDTAFTFEEKRISAPEIGRTLGVRYIVQGSVRKAEDRVRVNVRLIDAARGFETWGERYDRKLADIFELQSDLVREILIALRVGIREAEVDLRARRTTHNLQAYERYSLGMYHFQRFTRQDNLRARELFERTIELDPKSAGARAMLGATYASEYLFLWSLDPELVEKADRLVEEAHALDPDLVQVHTGRANVALAKGRWEEMAAAAQRAIELAPSLDVPHGQLALAQMRAGNLLLALESIRAVLRLNPRPRSAIQAIIALVNLRAGNRKRAIDLLGEIRASNPDFVLSRLSLATAYEQDGRHEEAQTLVREILTVSPRLTVEDVVARGLTFGDQADELRNAGLPERTE